MAFQKIRLTSSLLLLAFAANVQAKILQGQVTYVSDGDTFWVAVDKGSAPVKVRLQGVDAPETCQAWGREAKAALQAKLLRQTVQLNTRAKDDYQRLLARASLDGQDVGEWLVTQGHAWSYHYRRDPGPYAAQQATAQKRRAGLWAGAAPMEPRAFRKTHGACPH